MLLAARQALPGGLSVALCVLSSVSSAGAYVRATDVSGRPLSWQTRGLSLRVAMPPGPLGAALREATTSAARRWAKATGLDIRVDAEQDARARVSEDGITRVVLRSRRWCPDDSTRPCHDPTRSALTQLYTRPVAGSGTTAEILEADIEINAVHFDWLSLPPHALDAVVLHELGHVLGLDHTCRASKLLHRTDHRGHELPLCRDATGPLRAAVMYPDPLEARATKGMELSADELSAAGDLYGGTPLRGHQRAALVAAVALAVACVSAVWVHRKGPRRAGRG